MMTPGVRKLALTAHVTSSVAWLGAVAAFFVLSLAGLKGRDAEVVRAAYIAMDLIGRYAILPLSIAALVTGIVQSLGTPWGLFRHYWVVVKLVLTIGATFLLVLHQFTAVAGAAQRASNAPAGTLPEVGRWGTQLVADSTAALIVLLATTAIAIFKPWGLTSFGRRKQGSASAHPSVASEREGLPMSLKILIAVVVLVLLAFIMFQHGSGMSHHH